MSNLNYVRHDTTNTAVSSQPGSTTVTHFDGTEGWTERKWKDFNGNYQARKSDNTTRTPGTYQARNSNNTTRTPSAYQRHGKDNNVVSDGVVATLVYNITNTGGDFVLRSTGTVDYTVNWGDGNSESSTSNTLTHTYTAGDYTIAIDTDDAYHPFFGNISSDSEQITSVTIGADANLGSSINGTSIQYAWQGVNNMTSFVCPFDVTSNITDIQRTWQNCSSLTSFPLIDTSSLLYANFAWFGCSSLTSFPLLDTSSGPNFQGTWWNCINLTSFPEIDTSSGTNFQFTWKGCSSLTSFPSIDTSSATTLTYTWNDCSSLTSFPVIDLSGGSSINISNAWSGCTSLTTFPVLDYSNVLYMFNTWLNCALSVQSIENILVALDTAGKSNVNTSVSGGTSAAKTTWSAAANTAYANLISKGWTISFNA